MQAVLMIAAKALPAILAAGHAAAGAATAAASAVGTAAGATGPASSALSALRIGTSAISALSTFGQGQADAAAKNQEASDEFLASRQEYVQANEAANAINNRYAQTVGDQLAAASAMGISLSSGSVVQAQTNARQDADRQLTITRNGSDMNAALRRARAYSLQGQARSSSEGGALGGLAKLGQAFMSTATGGAA